MVEVTAAEEKAVAMILAAAVIKMRKRWIAVARGKQGGKGVTDRKRGNTVEW